MKNIPALVESRVIVEIKSVANLLREHQAQLLNYLKATGICVGLLVNFTRDKARAKVLKSIQK